MAKTIVLDASRHHTHLRDLQPRIRVLLTGRPGLVLLSLAGVPKGIVPVRPAPEDVVVVLRAPDRAGHDGPLGEVLARVLVGHAAGGDHLPDDHRLRHGVHPHALADGAVRPVQLGQLGLVPLPCGLFGEDPRDLFPEGRYDVLLLIVPEKVEEGVQSGDGGGVDGGEVQGQQPLGDPDGVKFFRPAFGRGNRDGPGYVVVGCLPVFVSWVAILLRCHIPYPLFDHGHAVLGRLPVVVLCRQPSQRT